MNTSQWRNAQIKTKTNRKSCTNISLIPNTIHFKAIQLIYQISINFIMSSIWIGPADSIHHTKTEIAIQCYYSTFSQKDPLISNCGSIHPRWLRWIDRQVSEYEVGRAQARLLQKIITNKKKQTICSKSQNSSIFNLKTKRKRNFYIIL